MLRAALVSLLNARRNNDVYVLVPVDGDQPARLAVEGVVYDPTSDMVLIRTEPWWLGPQGDDDELRDARPRVTREHEGWPAGRAARGQSGPTAHPPQNTPVAEHGDDLREPNGNAGRSATGGTTPSGDPHANCVPGARAGTQQTCDRCGRTLTVTPSDDFYCAAEGDHCCEACLVGGLPIFYVDPGSEA